MKIETSEINNIIIIAVTGKIDLYNIKEINDLFDKYIQEKKLQIILDLQNVPFMDSSGFVGLVTWTKKFQQINGSLKISNILGFVAKVIRQNSMTSLLQTYDSKEAAIQSFQTEA